MIALLASLKKESLLLMRDWHALALLFLMPALFIIIMSLALQDRFGAEQGMELAGQFNDQASTRDARLFRQQLELSPYLSLQDSTRPLSTSGELYAITLTADFSQALEARTDKPGVMLRFAPELGGRERALIRAAVQETAGQLRATAIAEELGYDKQYAEQEFLLTHLIVDATDTHSDQPALPSAVQQNVPAWLIFAMFFIAIPLSTAIIDERQQRTFIRLRTLGTSVGLIYSAKILPYFVINLLQLVLMLMLGIFLMPLLGGEALHLPAPQIPALLIMAVCTSLTALAAASLIASAARTTEQAAIASAAGNLLLAALGGVMVPVFMMPASLQSVAELSPMHWALSGFIELLVRQGSWSDIAAPAFKLLGLAALLFTAAWALIQRSTRHA
ncbi:ABC transporter permease [Gilvimarinus xylanilyticus]|uniref:ABC transporter permease n=1 Tax=Gilvimarinus xylanilyticus TaxID=2944139 RepID=A0A9X2I4D5_9GAMM|nr:ABC transporter permease [Gilvimarinus xylanilyticus]MCP8900140.1 ABC transporter permease [Gilvimarinus xylanilyticus]